MRKFAENLVDITESNKSKYTKLKEGEVKMRQNNILTDGEVAEGFILTCQSHPLTPTIYVDYDDI